MKATSTMILLSLFALGVLAAQSSSTQAEADTSAQQAPIQTTTPEYHLKVLSSRLNLSSDQQARVKVILNYQFAQMEAIRKNESLSAPEKASKTRGLSDATVSTIGELLND